LVKDVAWEEEELGKGKYVIALPGVMNHLSRLEKTGFP